MDNHTCTQEPEIRALCEKIISTDRRVKVVEDEVRDIRRLTVAVEKIADKTQNIEEKVDTLSIKIDRQDERVTEIENKPVKLWNTALDSAIKIIVGALITYILIKFGIGV